MLPLLRVKLYKAVHGKELVFADMKPPVSEAENNHRKSFFLHGLMQNLEFFLSSEGPQLDVTTVATQREESRKILRE